MTTHTIKANELEAVSIAMSTEDTRYYLNGVCIETYADGSCGMIATDGHRLHTINTQEAPVSSFILPAHDVKKSLAMYKAEFKATPRGILKDRLRLIIENNEGAINVSVALVITDKESGAEEISVKGAFNCKPVGGTFPDWRRTLPSGDCAAEEIAFSGEYLADFAKAAKLLLSACSRFGIKNTGASNPALITISSCPAFTGVLMPMRF